MTREEWLNRCAVIVEETLFKPAGYNVPRNRYSFAPLDRNSRSLKHTTLGSCYNAALSDDHTYEIFLNTKIDDEKTAIATLIHEIVHSVDELKNGHKTPFRKIAESVGLVGGEFKGKKNSMESTDISEATWQEVKPLIDRVGKLPHARLNDSASSSSKKKQNARQKKFYCLMTDYKVYMSRKQFHELGAPICPCCKEDMITDCDMD